MSSPPNLLLVLPHGLRSDALSDDGTWPLRTPHMAEMCRQGLRTIATSASPTDPGGLISLLTGLHPRQHGHVHDIGYPPLRDSLPSWLREAGYHVAGVGAVGRFASVLGESIYVADVSNPEPDQCAYWGYAASQGLTRALTQQRRQRLLSGPFEPDRLLIEPDDDIDGFIARQAEAALERMPADRPWALIVCFSGPANDLPPPTMYEDLVNPAALQTPFTPADLSQLDVLAEPVYPRIMLQRLEPYSIGRIRADYLGRVSLIDHGIGSLLQAVRQRRDGDRTWTLLSSDRGQLLGEHGLVGPRSFVGGAVEVPMIIMPPRGYMENGDEVAHLADGLISTVDFAATAAALGRCDVPHAVVGRSLLPLLAGDAVTPPAGGNLSEFNDRLLLETERLKAVFNRLSRTCLGLYDLLEDPDERNNLIASDRGKTLADALRWRLADALLPLRAAGWPKAVGE